MVCSNKFRILVTLVLIIYFSFIGYSQNLVIEDILNNPLSELVDKFETYDTDIKYDTLTEPYRFKFNYNKIYYVIFLRGNSVSKMCYRVIVTPNSDYGSIDNIIKSIDTKYKNVSKNVWEDAQIEIRLETHTPLFFEWCIKQ